MMKIFKYLKVYILKLIIMDIFIIKLPESLPVLNNKLIYMTNKVY